VLATSDPDGNCYLETKNLDGETNLKVRAAGGLGGVVRGVRGAARWCGVPSLRRAEGVKGEGAQDGLRTSQNLLLRRPMADAAGCPCEREIVVRWCGVHRKDEDGGEGTRCL
jgi:hypothetical protein